MSRYFYEIELLDGFGSWSASQASRCSQSTIPFEFCPLEKNISLEFQAPSGASNIFPSVHCLPQVKKIWLWLRRWFNSYVKKRIVEETFFTDTKFCSLEFLTFMKVIIQFGSSKKTSSEKLTVAGWAQKIRQKDFLQSTEMLPAYHKSSLPKGIILLNLRFASFSGGKFSKETLMFWTERQVRKRFSLFTWSYLEE